LESPITQLPPHRKFGSLGILTKLLEPGVNSFHHFPLVIQAAGHHKTLAGLAVLLVLELKTVVVLILGGSLYLQIVLRVLGAGNIIVIGILTSGVLLPRVH